MACLQQFHHRVAADIACSPGHCDTHGYFTLYSEKLCNEKNALGEGP